MGEEHSFSARPQFDAPRVYVFPALRLAREAGDIGGKLPAVMNAAKEVAVDAFLNGRIKFPAIWGMVERVMQSHDVVQHPKLAHLVEADRWARLKGTAFLGS